MRGNTLALLIVVAGVVCLALGVFYLIPGPYHPFTFSGTPTGSHVTHAVVFFALGVVALIGSRFARTSSGRS
jgi:hypothetical protein